jgi:hypothetical protein
MSVRPFMADVAVTCRDVLRPPYVSIGGLRTVPLA